MVQVQASLQTKSLNPLPHKTNSVEINGLICYELLSDNIQAAESLVAMVRAAVVMAVVVVFAVAVVVASMMVTVQ